MDGARFNQVLEEQIDRITQILGVKNEEYASDTDKLHNFKVAAALQGVTPIEALRGMMVKHTVSIYDMIKADPSGMTFPLEKWDEKITDSINYHILLRALLAEQDDEDAALGTNGTN